MNISPCIDFGKISYCKSVIHPWITIQCALKFQVWEHDVDGNTTFRVCDGSGEDPDCCRWEPIHLSGSINLVNSPCLLFRSPNTCSAAPCLCICRSVFALFLSASDHLTYMGVEIAADDWSTCRIVMAQSVERLQLYLASNVITSEIPVDIIIADHSVQTDPSSSS